MDANIDQHAAFHAPWEAFCQLIAAMKSNEKPYNASDLQKAVHGFMPVLHPHLEDEIQTLKADRLKGVVTEKDMAVMEKMLTRDIQDNLKLLTDTPLLVILGDLKHGAW